MFATFLSTLDRSSKVRSTFALALLGGVLLTQGAPKAHADSFTLGNNVHPFYVSTNGSLGTQSHYQDAGGDAQGVLNGELLRGTYCVAILNPVYAGGSYPTTTVSSDGSVFGSAVNNAGKISWLLTNYGNNISSVDEENALQAAIWRTEYGSEFQVDGVDNANTGNSATMLTDYQTFLSGLGNNLAPVNKVLWISPADNTPRSVPYQGLVGVRASTFVTGSSAAPEPGAASLLGVGLLSMGASVLRRRRIA